MSANPFLPTILTSLVPVLVFLPLPAEAGTSGGLIATDFPASNVYSIDPTDASVTFLSSISGINDALGSLELAPDGYFYGVTAGNARLFRIDPTTWHATLVGLLGTVVAEGGLAIDASGNAWYASTQVGATLFQIDLSTGAATTVGSMGNYDVGGLDLRSDGMLIALDRITNGLLLTDPGTAGTTPFATLSTGTVGDLGGLVILSSGGYLVTTDGGLGFPGSNQLIEFDPFTGANAPVGVLSAAGQGPEGFLSLAAFAEIGVKYCITNANSTAAPADLSASGSASSVAGNLTLTALPVPNQFGVFFHGLGGAQIPFGCSFQCTVGGIQRGALITGAGNVATYTYDNSDPKHNLGPFAGMTRHFQYWFRDPAGAAMCGGQTFNTSNAMAIAILP